ncbi:hypothetical protein JD76_03171 [Micromonospora endolithica]|nr:hypothetical protein JD76_03171 [Micromonospora endolithica]
MSPCWPAGVAAIRPAALRRGVFDAAASNAMSLTSAPIVNSAVAAGGGPASQDRFRATSPPSGPSSRMSSVCARGRPKASACRKESRSATTEPARLKVTGSSVGARTSAAASPRSASWQAGPADGPTSVSMNGERSTLSWSGWRPSAACRMPHAACRMPHAACRRLWIVSSSDTCPAASTDALRPELPHIRIGRCTCAAFRQRLHVARVDSTGAVMRGYVASVIGNLGRCLRSSLIPSPACRIRGVRCGTSGGWSAASRGGCCAAA